ncbi:uncharacterized protein LOC123466251 [Daphnia magna]|uniref:uncharacterized protein LOC116916602 n=1 Tax=Daphnia magna TaxID=35525 RepID=UPI0014020390|nr:uncharacterized protein LOC116916602 [Daphnia magna]XP_045028386.1 uncharacterized protein LOC123466251 [Daphnia magna]XP_045028387.1 uncharacterized protein LOC123466251 [Daphnia magna]
MPERGEMFLIVEYIIGEHETEVEVVPSSWYSSGQCWWPPGAFARSTLEKKVSKSVDCDKATWDCYDARLIATFKTYAEAKAKLPLAIAGESVAPSSTDVDGHKKGKGKREKQKTRRYLSEDTSESSDDGNRKNKENSSRKKKKRSPARPSQNDASVSANLSDTHMTLPPVPNSLNINTFFSSQSSNEVSHTRPRIESTENERSNSFGDRNGVTDEIMSSPVIPRQQLAVARKSNPSPSAPTSPEVDARKIGVILQRVEALARGIEVVKANQREVLDLLTLLLKNSAPPQPDLPSITELFQLPMKTLQDARNLTKLLKIQHNASKMKTFVIGIGGTTNSMVGRVMKSIMTYRCGSCFCYLGLNEDKVAFKSTTICEIVIDGVREAHNSLTRDAVEAKIKNWLRHCPRYASKQTDDGSQSGEDEEQEETY